MTALLEIDQLSAGYGDFQALFDLDLSVSNGESLAIIGANGAGKTTLLRAISGLIPAMSGSIRFEGEDLLAIPAHQRVSRGVAMVPEGRLVFPSLSVRENLQVGSYSRREGQWNLDRVRAVFPLLEPLLDRDSGFLSGGEKQTVAIGRALMSNPRLLLLDEVSLGLAPIVVRQVYEALPDITASGTTALVVEQDIGQAMSVAERVICMLEGKVSLEGRPDSIRREAITAAYFGMEASEGIS